MKSPSPGTEVGAGKRGQRARWWEYGSISLTSKMLTCLLGDFYPWCYPVPEACAPSSHPLLRPTALEQTPRLEAPLWCWGNGRTKQTKPLPSGGFLSNRELDNKTDE